MKHVGTVLGLLALVLGVYAASQSRASASGNVSAFSTFAHPSSVDGIPVHYLVWNSALPGISAVDLAWKPGRPSSFLVPPKMAILRALSNSFMRRHTQVIYVQTAGVQGGRTGNPRSAYIVETVGHYGMYGAGPVQPKPPLESIAVLLVNGRNGTSELLMTAQEHGIVRNGRSVLTPMPPNSLVPSSGGTPKPIAHLWMDSAQCPTSWSRAECQEFRQAPPMPGDDVLFKATDYWEGITEQIIAGEILSSSYSPPQLFIGKPHQGFLLVNGPKAGDNYTLLLPLQDGVPTLTKVIRSSGYPVAYFITSTGRSGYFDVGSRIITWK